MNASVLTRLCTCVCERMCECAAVLVVAVGQYDQVRPQEEFILAYGSGELAVPDESAGTAAGSKAGCRSLTLKP